jgi:His/Glu/Gln/Arg/opine family amino acid ABC transporter permease subunit
VIATDATYPPFEFMEDGKLQGFDIDLGNALGREIGVPVRWLPMEWAGVFGALETRKCDLIMSGVTITEERKKEGNGFTRPYFLSGQVIARRKGDARFSGPDDLKADTTVAVQQETTGQYAVEKRGLPKDRIRRFDTLQDALMDVRNRKSDAAVGDLPALQAMIRKGYPELELTPGGIIARENVGIVARKNDLDLIHALNQALDRVLVDGRYAQIYARWIEEPMTGEMIARLDEVKNAGTAIPVRLLAGCRPAAVRRRPDAAGRPAAALPAAPDGGPGGSALSIRWELLGRALPVLLAGARLTLVLTLLTLAIGVPAGLLVALARLSHWAPLRLLATAYVEVVRGTPLLMQIYVIYFVLPAVGVGLPPFAAGVAALSLNAAAYISEIFRAGIESIDSGQMEAARALGMDYRDAMRWVILPQTLRRVLPPLTNEAVALLKDSSLVSVVALAELMRVGKELASTSGAPTTVYLAIALLYLSMTLPLTWLVRRLESRWQPISRPRERPRKRGAGGVAVAAGRPAA